MDGHEERAGVGLLLALGFEGGGGGKERPADPAGLVFVERPQPVDLLSCDDHCEVKQGKGGRQIRLGLKVG